MSTVTAFKTATRQKDLKLWSTRGAKATLGGANPLQPLQRVTVTPIRSKPRNFQIWRQGSSSENELEETTACSRTKPRNKLAPEWNHDPQLAWSGAGLIRKEKNWSNSVGSGRESHQISRNCSKISGTHTSRGDEEKRSGDLSLPWRDAWEKRSSLCVCAEEKRGHESLNTPPRKPTEPDLPLGFKK